MTTVRIALDAMGGDAGPEEAVHGALMAAGGLGVEVLLVGRTEEIEAELVGTMDNPALRIVDARDIIAMDDSPTDAVRNKPDSSMNVGLGLVREGKADAFVTMGNTGAAMAAALLRLGRVKGIARPALATVFPAGVDGATMILDVGANADCRVVHLIQFAHMGSAYMQRILGVERPRVALLSIGEEDSKGNQLTIEAHQALRSGTLNFVGNIEGSDLVKHAADVVVTDGFTGNVLLKTAEGIGELFFHELERAVRLTPWNMAAGLVLKSELRKVARRLDYSEYGGAQLLGINGVVLIGHGRSNARAIFNAVRASRDAVQRNLVGEMVQIGGDIPARRSGATDESDE